MTVQNLPKPSDNIYGISSEDYLKRAKRCLLNGERTDLFYAALELRCCIEKRQNEYLSAQKEYAKSIPKSWNIGKQHSALRKVFNTERIQLIKFHFDEDQSFSVFYVPINSGLKNATEKLGGFLHAQTNYREPEDKWWVDFRHELLDIYQGAWECCKGQLLSPALIDKEKALGKISLRLNGKGSTELSDLLRGGKVFVLEAEYLQSPPSNWISDLYTLRT